MVEIKCNIDDKSLIVDTSILSKILDVSTRQIGTYIKKGMPKNINSSHKKNLFDVIECFKWVEENIDKTKSFKNEDLDVLEVKQKREVAEMEKATEQAKIEKIKRLQLEEKLIDINKTDKAMAEVGALFVSTYRNDLKVLPVLLENKSISDIQLQLNEHYKKRVEDVAKIVSKEVKPEDLTIYDKLFEWINSKIKE